jgi:hypothetical protein
VYLCAYYSQQPARKSEEAATRRSEELKVWDRQQLPAPNRDLLLPLHARSTDALNLSGISWNSDDREVVRLPPISPHGHGRDRFYRTGNNSQSIMDLRGYTRLRISEGMDGSDGKP